MQVIIGIIVFGLILLAIIILVVINFTYKNFRQIREAFEERREMNQRMKEQKEKNPFGDDYFKSSEKSSRHQHQTQYDFRQKTTHQRQTEEQKKTTARKTTTDSGITIIDDRGEAEKKIFDHNDGEYVEYTEVEN